MKDKNVFIGREDELKKLRTAYKEASNGKGKLVLVEGSAGVGKSAFVREFINEIRSNSDTIIGISECNDKGDLNVYAPFKELLIELNVAHHKKGKRKNLINFFKEAGTSWIELIPVFGTYAKVGIETFEAGKKYFKGETPPIINSENDVYRIFENEFRRLAKDKTVVIFIDDLQWADSSSLNLIFSLGKAIRGNSFNILFIGSYRYNEVKAGRNKITESGVKIPHPFEDKLNMLRTYTKSENHINNNGNWFQEININPFTKTEVTEFIHKNFIKNQFQQPFIDNLFHLTDGHPLFVSEILEHLIATNVIHKNEDEIYINEEIKLENLPKSIDGVISEKVARLNKELLKILTHASVNGEEFTLEIIEKILKIDEDDDDLLMDSLEELDEIHGILFEEDTLDDIWYFSQTLVHQFIYKKMSNSRRRKLHRKIASYMKEIYNEELEKNKKLKDKYNLHVQIGQGLIDGISLQMNSNNAKNEPSEEQPTNQVFIDAATAELQNAKDSYKLFAMNEVQLFVDKALAFLSKVDENSTTTLQLKFNLLKCRDKAYQWLGHYKKAYDTAIEMFEIANKINKISSEETDGDSVAQSNLMLGNAQIKLGFLKDAFTCFEKAIAYYETTNNYKPLWETYISAGETKIEMAAYDDAMELFNKSLLISEKIEDLNTKGRSLYQLGLTSSKMLQEFPKIMEFLNQALSIFETNNNETWVGKTNNRIGLEYRSKGNYSKATEFLEKALTIAKNQNDLVNISNYYNNIALVEESQENFDVAIEYYTKSLEIDTRLDDKPHIAMSLNNIGSIYIEKNDFKRAIEYLDKSLVVSKSFDNSVQLATNYYITAEAFKKMKENDKAEEYYKKAIDIDTTFGDKPSLSIHFYMLGNFYYDISNYDSATTYLLKSLELFNIFGNNSLIATANNMLGFIKKADGNTEEAIELYQKSLDYYIAVNDKKNQSDILDNIAKSYYDQQEYNTAIKFYEKAIVLAERLNEKNYLSRQYSGIGDTYLMLDEYDKATNYYIELLDIETILYGENSIEVADAHAQMANNFYWNSNYELAIKNYQKALNLKTEIYGKHTSEVDFLRYKLAEIEYFSDNNEIAKQLFYESLEFREKDEGKDSEAYKNVQEYIHKIDIEILTDEGKEHSEQSNYNEALEKFQKALNLVDVLPVTNRNKTTKGNIYYLVGRLYSNANEYDESIQYLTKAYTVFNEISDCDYYEIARVCSFLGDSYTYKNDYKNALKYHTEAHQKMTDANDTESIMFGWANYDIGFDYAKLKEHSKAIDFFNEALKIKVALNGEEHKEVANCYLQLGDCHLQLDNDSLAIHNFEKSYKIREKLFSATADETDEARAYLGFAHLLAKNFEIAKQLFETSLDYRQQKFGIDSEACQQIEQYLIAIQKSTTTQTKKGNAAPKHKQSSSGEIVTKLEVSYKNDYKEFKIQGDQFFDDKNYEESLNQYKQAIETSNFLPANDENLDIKATIYHKIGDVYFTLKNYDNALENYINTFNTLIKISEANQKTSDFAITCTSLGTAYYFKKDYKNAIENHKEALKYTIEMYGEEDEMTAWRNYDIGKDYYQLDVYEDAIAHFEKAIETRTKIKGLDDKWNGLFYLYCADSYYYNNQELLAIEKYKVAISIREKMYGVNSAEADLCNFKIGRAYYYVKDTEKAKQYIYTSLKFRENFYGEDSEKYNYVLNWKNKHKL